MQSDRDLIPESEMDPDVVRGQNEEDILDEYARTRAVADTGFRDMSYHEGELLQEFCRLPLPCKPYTEFRRFAPGQELVLVIGGETHGVSERARKFAHEHLGERVHVPLANSMDSLNVVSAASVILFEIKRAVEIADKVE